MITCKEDLINTYIEDDQGELRDVYFSIAEKFGFLIDEGDYTLGIISVMKDCKYVQDISSLELVRKCKKLTLSDLKPRTKVEYELIKFESTADAYRTMLDGEKLYSQDGESEFLFDDKNFVGIDSDGGVYTLECHSDNEPFYRKVERPVEWFDDAVEYLNQNRQSGSCDEQGVLSVGADMTRDQWCDFARILLEQEGE